MLTDKDLTDRLAPLGDTKLSDEQFSRLRRNIQNGITNSRKNRKPSPIWGMGKVAVAVLLPLVMVAAGVYSFTHHTTAHKNPLKVISPSPSVPLTGVQMYGKEDGWMIGSTQQLLRTTDGGKHWVNVTPPAVTNTDTTVVTVASAKVASIAVGSIQGQKASTAIYHTVDGGTKWSKTPLNPSKANAQTGIVPYSMMFADKAHGWMSTQIPDFGMGGARPGPLYRTGNGGTTWSLTSQTVAKNIVSFRWVYFLNQKDGFTEGASQALGADAGETNTNPEKLYATHDGGAHWSLANIALPPGNLVKLLQPTFFGKGQGVLPVVQTNLAQDNTVYFYTTTGSGVQWRQSGKVVVNQPRDNVVVDVLDAKHWWVYWGGRLYATSNAGRSFASTSVAISNVADLDFVSQRVGFAIVDKISGPQGEKGFLYTTSDGGKTWTPS